MVSLTRHIIFGSSPSNYDWLSIQSFVLWDTLQVSANIHIIDKLGGSIQANLNHFDPPGAFCMPT